MILKLVFAASMLVSGVALACPHCAEKEGKAGKEAKTHQMKDKAGCGACHADAEKICGKDTLKDHEAVHKCLDANKDKLSKACLDHRAQEAGMNGHKHEMMHGKKGEAKAEQKSEPKP